MTQNRVHSTFLASLLLSADRLVFVNSQQNVYWGQGGTRYRQLVICTENVQCSSALSKPKCQVKSPNVRWNYETNIQYKCNSLPPSAWFRYFLFFDAFQKYFIWTRGSEYWSNIIEYNVVWLNLERVPVERACSTYTPKTFYSVLCYTQQNSERAVSFEAPLSFPYPLQQCSLNNL